MKVSPYKIEGFLFDEPLSDNSTFVSVENYNFFQKWRFNQKVSSVEKAAVKRLEETIEKGECFYGPFKGEYGHFLAHTLPFLMFLHKNGVKIHYCGMGIHEALMQDENGRSILASFTRLRDFFAEVPPSSNSTIPPDDVQEVIKEFKEQALGSDVPFWNIDDNFYYWFVHRHWLLRGHAHVYDLSKVYGDTQENACAIFPRSKGAKSSHNNGEAWDYNEVINRLAKVFDKIYVCGHPSQVFALEDHPKVVSTITSDNAEILKSCSNSRMIVTPHSGVNNLGEYLNKPVLIIYKGGSKVSDIGSMQNTVYFRQGLGNHHRLRFAFSLDQIEEQAALIQ